MTEPGGGRPPTSTTFWRSLGHAWDGVLHAVVHQRNLRLHLLAAMLVSQVGCGLELGLTETVALLLAVALVVFAELLNTALEQVVDLATSRRDERARIAKDAAAGAVLVLAVGTVGVLAAVLVARADLISISGDAIQRQVAVGVPLTVALGVLMHEARRPAWVDVAVALAALGLWAWSATFSRSAVFSALALALLALGAAAARARRQAPVAV